VEIRPFRAYRYNPKILGDVGSCVAPPYDVISAEHQEQLYRKSQYNIVRIIKGKTYPTDNQHDNQYTRAAQYLNRWIEQGVLQQDPVETIYAYVQDFEVNDCRYRRYSFIALARLEEFGKTVRPHEQTLNEPIIDRLNLKRATEAKFGLAFMLYDDPQYVADSIIAEAAKQTPLVDFRNDDAVRHRLFALTDSRQIEAIAGMMRDKCCVIADGHHRYTTGLTYSRENPNPQARYQMLAFANVHNQGVVILATHRLVGNLERFDPAAFVEAAGRDFALTAYRFDSGQAKADARAKALAHSRAEHESGKNAFTIYCGDGSFYVAVLKNQGAMASASPEKSRAWRSLDVAVLQKLVLEKLLCISEAQLARGDKVKYVRDMGTAVDDAIAAVDRKEKQVLFLMNPTRWEQIKAVTDAGERMPQKSTYFYPKIYTGLTINKL